MVVRKFLFLFLLLNFFFLNTKYRTVRAASNEEGKELTTNFSKDLDKESSPLVKKEEGEGEEDGVEGLSGETEYNYTFFHIIFAIGYMYMACLLTNWRLLSSSSVSNSFAVDESIVSVWVKVVSSWLTLGLYLWTIINSCVFPDRK
jgi:hypothetical protein